jgi:hypothetical protein
MDYKKWAKKEKKKAIKERRKTSGNLIIRIIKRHKARLLMAFLASLATFVIILLGSWIVNNMKLREENFGIATIFSIIILIITFLDKLGGSQENSDYSYTAHHNTGHQYYYSEIEDSHLGSSLGSSFDRYDDFCSAHSTRFMGDTGNIYTTYTDYADD